MSFAPKPGCSLAGELEDCLRQIDAIQRDAEHLTSGLTDAQFNWRPAPGKWSIAECVSHLEVVGSSYLPNIDAAILHASEEQWYRIGPYRYGFVESWFVRANEPPPRIRMKAPRSAAPLAFQPRRELMARFLSLQQDLRDRARRANGLDLARAKVDSPLVRVFRMSLGACLAFLPAHERRHLWQAGHVRNHPDFPGA